MAKKKEDVVFKDVKKSLTIGQFDVIVELLQEDYDKLAKALKVREDFESNALEKFRDQEESMPPGFLDKLIKGLVRKAEKEFNDIFKEEMNRSEHVRDFLNTFRTRDNQLTRLVG